MLVQVVIYIESIVFVLHPWVFAPVIVEVLKNLRTQISGMVHCSGGAQTKVLHFIGDNIHVIKDNLFDVPPLFRIIQEESKTPWNEMFKVFNMGHRMEIYLDEKFAQQVIDIANQFKIDAQIVGRVEAGNFKQVTVQSKQGEFIYN